jgi:hypothetical protein
LLVLFGGEEPRGEWKAALLSHRLKNGVAILGRLTVDYREEIVGPIRRKDRVLAARLTSETTDVGRLLDLCNERQRE